MQAKEQAGELVKLLKGPNPDVRIAAASALGALGWMPAKEQTPELVRLLKDPNYFVRSRAASVLGQMRAKEQVPELVELLKDPESSVRNEVASVLGRMQAKKEARELAKLLKDPDSAERRKAASLLGWMQAKEQAAELVKSLQDPVSEVRGAAASALGRMQAKERAPELVKLLKDPDAKVRSAAAWALGQMQATEQASELAKLLKDPDWRVRIAAASTLWQMRAKLPVPELVLLKDPDLQSAGAYALGRMQAKERAPELVKLLKDPDPKVRSAAAWALGQMQAKEQARELVKLLKDPAFVVHPAATAALKLMGPLPREIVLGLSSEYYSNHEEQPEARFLCYYLTGGDRSVALILRRVMLTSEQQPVKLASADEAREEIHAFADLLPVTRLSSDLSQDADHQILQIVREWKGARTEADDVGLNKLADGMSFNDPDNARLLREIIPTPWWRTAPQKAWKLIALQAAFWVLLIYFYPRSAWVQALFFWNRWTRKIFGLLYVDVCLTFIPFLRNRLLAPFKEDLAADARVQDGTLQDYFTDVEVQERGAPGRFRIGEAIPDVRGQIVLEGESGLGKSTFLRLLVKESRSPIVYLPASSCEPGVFEAIQLRLKGKASDEGFLKTIIWSGGLSVIVDGLNEVTFETRETIQRFLRDFPKAHVILATQPLPWKRPPKARVFVMLPLSEDRILKFLESRYPSFEAPKMKSEAAYQSSCREFLGEILSPAQGEEDRSNALFVLSNPMDLSTAALLLASGERPTLSKLQDQQFKQMAADYKRNHAGEDVPLTKFSESVYEARLRDEAALGAAEFFALIQEMVAHKMALRQADVDADQKPITKWVFRHDKVRDYFLMQAFLADQERIPKHIDDPRFRGVYLMLASGLPLEQATELRETLVERAAETKDHLLSDAVVQILKARRARTPVEESKAVTAGG